MFSSTRKLRLVKSIRVLVRQDPFLPQLPRIFRIPSFLIFLNELESIKRYFERSVIVENFLSNLRGRVREVIFRERAPKLDRIKPRRTAENDEVLESVFVTDCTVRGGGRRVVFESSTVRERVEES